MLLRGVSVLYVDHHGAARIPVHPLLHALIDNRPDVCTGILVDRYLQGRYRVWPVAAAFGDGLDRQAEALACSLSLDAQQTAALRDLGICLNYNAYGGALAELNVDPALLYVAMRRYADPFEFIQKEALCQRIRAARDRDRPVRCGMPCGFPRRLARSCCCPMRPVAGASAASMPMRSPRPVPGARMRCWS